MSACPPVPAAPARDLRGRAARGIVIQVASQALTLSVQLASMVFLARLLSPHDFGLAAMVMTVYAFVQLFAEAGLSAASIQNVELDDDQAGAIFWTNCALGLLLAGLSAACSPLIAWFFNESELARLNLLLAMGFILSTAGMQHQARLQKQMRFGVLSVIEFTAILTGLTLAITLGAVQLGPWAIVAQYLAASACRTLGYWTFSGWSPRRPRWSGRLAGMFRFGGFLTADRIVRAIARNMDRLLIGRICGAVDTGFYTRAQALATFPQQALTTPVEQVMFPLLVQLKGSPARMQAAYLRAVQLLAMCNFPLVVFLILAADDIILLIYGSRWSAVVPLFRLLCVASLWEPIQGSLGWLYLTTGKTDRLLHWRLAELAVSLTGVSVGIHFGVYGAAVGYVAVRLAIAAPFAYYTLRSTGVEVSAFLDRVSRVVLVSIPSTAVLLLASRTIAPHLPGPLPRVLVLLALFAGTLAASIRLTMPGQAAELASSLRAAFSRR